MTELPILIITIDAEGDNLWRNPHPITTENARYVPRFQALCDQFGFKPSYLVNYEMALDATFQAFGRQLLATDTGEIGLHVHPWVSPPFEERPSYDPQTDKLYLYELPDDVLFAKMQHQHDLLKVTFDVTPVSHRAGRWGLDERVARVLVELGYRVDCSVTPGLSWRKHPGLPNGRGGPDYRRFPSQPYFMDLTDIRRRGSSPLLQIPCTIRRNFPPPLPRLLEEIEHTRLGRRLQRLLGPSYSWFRPNGANLAEMLSLVDWVITRRQPVLEFMLHSSELMPGGSPTFDTEEKIERLYAHLATIFAYIAEKGIGSMMLAEYYAHFRGRW